MIQQRTPIQILKWKISDFMVFGPKNHRTGYLPGFSGMQYRPCDQEYRSIFTFTNIFKQCFGQRRKNSVDIFVSGLLDLVSNIISSTQRIFKELICKRRSFRLTSRVEYVLANAYNGRFSFILLISSHSSRLYLSQSKITPHRRALFSISFNKSSRSFG